MTQSFFFVRNPDPGLVLAIRDAAAALQQGREWFPSPPDFIDETEEAESPEDEDLRIVGIVLDVVAAAQPGGQLSADAERVQFENFLCVLREAAEISKARGVTFTVTYNDEEIGDIVRGEVGNSIDVGLIRPWKIAAGV